MIYHFGNSLTLPELIREIPDIKYFLSFIFGVYMSCAKKHDSLIEETIQNYFWGTYEADGQKIRSAFHEKAIVSGLFDGEYTEWNLDEFIKRVVSRPSPSSLNEVFSKKIMGIEQKDNIAFVNAFAPAYGYNFTDYIILIKTEDDWKIRHKSFTNSP